MTTRNDRRVALIVGAILAAAFTLCSALQVASWTVGSVERTAHEVIPGPVRVLTLDVRDADVSLVRAQGDAVMIDSRSSGTLHTPKLKVRPEGARVRVTGGCPDITFGHCEAKIFVKVPAQTSVKVEAGSGDVFAEGLSGSADLHSASGEVSVHDLSGPAVELRSSSGDVFASGLRADSVLARSNSGTVSVQFNRVPTSVEARSNSGDVAVFVPPGEEIYRVDARTNSGDTHIGVDDSLRGTIPIEARTNSGDVTVDYGT